MKNYCFTMNVAILIVILTAINPSIADIGNDLRGYWRFDEEEYYTIVYDTSGNENHGRTIGSPIREPGVSGTALAFDGVNDYVEIPDSNSLHSDRQITITGWFFLNKYPPGSTTIPQYGNFMNLFWKGNRPDCTGPDGCGNREYGLWVHKDGYLTFLSTPEGTNKQVGCLTGEGIVRIKRWYHFGAVVNSDQGRMRLYVDGNLEGENASYGSSNIRQTSGPLLFGGDEYDPTAWRYPFFDGLMDEVRIHGKALRKDEIQWLYEHPCMFELLGDVNNDCVFNFLDIAIMAANWLVNCKQTPYDPACVYIAPEIPGDKVLIPGGEFDMGDHFEEGFYFERPVHSVLLDSFFMSKFEITNFQYCDFLNSADVKVDGGIVYASLDDSNSFPYCDTHSSSDFSHIDYNNVSLTFSVKTKGGRDMSDDPIVQVSWYGAAAYCNWRSQLEGYEACYDLSTWVCDFTKKGYRLSTEAEWEYAARGGNRNPYYRFPWGDTINHDYANYRANGSAYSYDTSPYTTSTFHPDWFDGIYPPTSVVGSFSANGYGLYDMTGNVWELCNDWYDSNYYDSSPYDNPQGPASGSSRVERGGSWISHASNCRISFRLPSPPDTRSYYSGFRVVLDLN